jgi:beta-lactamase regulating signal transducer with metallopeptidase domain
MNELGISLLWCAIQATLYLLVGLVLYAIVRRFGPAPGASAAASMLVVLCCVSIAAFSPWPRWWTLLANDAQRSADDPPATQPADNANTALAASTDVTAQAAAAPEKTTKQPGSVPLGDYWRVFKAELQAAQSDNLSAGSSLRWPAIVGMLLLAGASLALIRFAIGLVALRRYRRCLQPINDPALGELVDKLARQIGCRRTIELMQSPSLTTPATMGWRRPVIVLPGDWHTWSEQERRVVLAHEMAHIARGDYLSWLLGQVSVALHVYHPLVHWLCGRLRLEQELAADAWAADLSGGREAYLFTLAQMALRQDDRRVAWAARPFLPSRGTLLRRIEMLNDTKPLRNIPISRRRAATFAFAAAIIGLVVSGVRAPLGDAPQLASAAPPATPTAAQALKPIDLSYVPARAVAVLAVRPAELLSNADMQPLVKLLNEATGLEQRTGLKIENIEEVKLALTRLPDRPGNMESMMLQILRHKEPFDWKGKIGENVVGKPVEATIAGKTYYHSDHGDAAIRPAFYLPDDRTIVIGPEIDLQRAIVSGGKSKPEWAGAWEKSATGQAVAMVDLTAVNRAVSEEIKQHPAPQAVTVFAPIWEKGQRLFVTVQKDQGLDLASRIDCATADDAGRVQETAQAVLTLARNLLDEADRALAKGTAEQAGAVIPLVDLASEVLKKGKVQTEGSSVTYSSKLDVDVADTAVSVVAPAVIAVRQASGRQQAMNNMKQIMLAMHNYHDVHGHFPPPVVIGPDGKTPHSWRIEILPYVEQAQLYQQYKMDEPWDSENNMKVLAQMPTVLRDPSADPNSKVTSYFALTGPATAFGPTDGKGTKFQDIRDGTSNTIAFVEAKRAVPWTKPEDIDYSPDKPMPKFGGWRPGGFIVATCDGAVRFVQDNLDQQVLRAMITKAGGEPLSIPSP